MIYACEWSDRDVTGFEAIGWFYGTETVRDWRGESRVNLFACVDQSEWPFLEEVSLRTWREGGEDCTISLVEPLPGIRYESVCCRENDLTGLFDAKVLRAAETADLLKSGVVAMPR